jgi:hypothetical protein
MGLKNAHQIIFDEDEDDNKTSWLKTKWEYLYDKVENKGI